MTNKKLKVNNTAYTELSIQIGVLEAKVDKVFQLLLEQQQNTVDLNLKFPNISDNEVFDERYK